MAAPKKTDAPQQIEVASTTVAVTEIGIVGLSPFICNRMSEKAKRTLLFPPSRTGRKTSGDRTGDLKHDPVAEFQASPYTLGEPDGPLLAMMASSFKGAMMTAALDLPGAAKTQIGRLVTVHGFLSPLYGEPRLFMKAVRSADINKTPDIRTRAIVARWATTITVQFVVPLINQKTVANLLTTGGQTAGVGDWRPEKGKGSFGRFRICDLQDPELLEIMASGDRATQEMAMKNAEPYDMESAELLQWYTDELNRRGL